MRSVSVRLADLDRVKINLGIAGENEHTHVLFDCKKAFDQYPNATPFLIVTPPRGDIYPAVVTRDGDIVEWVVTDSDLIYHGNGKVQLQFKQGDIIMKSYEAMTSIAKSSEPTGTVPTPIQNWITQANAILASIPDDINAALAAAKASGEFDGADGVGIAAITLKSTVGLVDTYTITLTDGRDYDFTVTNGTPGQNGVGIQSIAKTSTVGLVDTYTITLTNGQTYPFTVTNGQNGVEIDDTTPANNKVFSSAKVDQELTDVKTAIQGKTDIFSNTVKGDTVHIIDGIAGSAVAGLKLHILPTQAGTGEPSPINFRELTGHTGANINQSGIDVNNPTVTQVSWQTEAGTVYYALVDVLNRTITVTHKCFTLAFDDMNLSENYPGWRNVAGLGECYSASDFGNVTICNMFKSEVISYNVRIVIDSEYKVYIPKEKLGVSGQEQAKEMYAGKNLVFVSPLITPVTYQIDEISGIELLAGENYFWTNAGETEVTYKCVTKEYIDNKADKKIEPAGTTFFEGINHFDPARTKYIYKIYIHPLTGVITSSSGTNSIIIPVEPNTTYWFYIPNINRGYVGTSITDDFVVGQAYTVVGTTSPTNEPITFTTDAVARYAIISFYSGDVYDYEGNKDKARLYIGQYNNYGRVYIPNKFMPVDAINPLTDANILIFGDSITACCEMTINSSKETTAYSWKNPSTQYVNAGGTTIKYSKWPKILKLSQPVKEIRNYAFGGAQYKTKARSSGEEMQDLQYQIDVAMNDLSNPHGVFSVDDFVPDIVIFALGVNDWIPADDYDTAMSATVYDGDTIDVEATLLAIDDTKTIGSARKAYMRIKQAFPTAQIFVVLPLQIADKDTSIGTIHTYLKQMAERYGCIVVDGAYESGITRDFNVANGLGMYLTDGVHPNEKGQNMIARMILSSIKAHYMPFTYGFN